MFWRRENLLSQPGFEPVQSLYQLCYFAFVYIVYNQEMLDHVLCHYPPYKKTIRFSKVILLYIPGSIFARKYHGNGDFVNKVRMFYLINEGNWPENVTLLEIC